MKSALIKSFCLTLVGLLIGFHSQAQYSLNDADSLPDTKSTKIATSPKLEVDSALDSVLFITPQPVPKKVANTKKKAEEVTIDSVGNTVVIQTTTAAKESDNAEDKIAELSEFLSGDNVFYTLIFLLFGFAFVKVSTFILNALAERSTNYRITFKGLIPIVKIISWIIILTLIIVVIFQPPISTMLAFSASIGVAVGFASQDILKNVFGGIVILLDRPFVSGDKIEVDKYYGEVVEIGLRSTRIVTADDSLVSVPNAVVMNSSLSNANAGEPNCQVVAEIFLPLTVDTISTREIATQAATVSKYIYLGKPITILFSNELDTRHSFYKMKVKAYVMDIRDEFRFKSDMTELIIKELVREGVLDKNF